MDRRKFEDVITLALEFSKADIHILALGLCGSWARGTPNSKSDIDLSLITTNKELFRNTNWLKEIDFNKVQDNLLRFEDKKYGSVWSRHVFLESGVEIEFSFADKSWANIDPVDSGTQKVVSDGYRILYDPHQILSRLVSQLNTNP